MAKGNIGEVDNQIGTLCEPHKQRIAQCCQVDRCRQEATFVANLPYFHARDLIEVQDQEARLAAIQETDSVAALLNGLEGPGVAVDHDHIAEELGVPDRREVGVRNKAGKQSCGTVEEFPGIRIEQGTVSVERPILNGDRDLVVRLVRWELVVCLGGRAWEYSRKCLCGNPARLCRRPGHRE